MTQTSFQALIQLIDDPDEMVFAEVRKQVSFMGISALPELEISQEDVYGSLLFQKRIDGLIQDIRFEEAMRNFSNWLHSNDRDLFHGAMIVAQYQYPNLEIDKIRTIIHEIKRAIWLEISPMSTAFEKVKVMNKVLFEHFNYHVNEINTLSPLNSYINTALELKTGSALSLSVIYSIVAQELDMPVYGVNVPNHFLLAYIDELHINAFLGKENPYGVLFYIDALQKGKIVSEEAIINYLEKESISSNRNCFEPCSNTQIIQLMLSNLIYSYNQLGMKRKAKELATLKEMTV